jgi:dTDP-4-amino-4,6-dideoxygalactose transaminase
MLLVKMNHLGKWTEKRRSNAAFYKKHLEKVVTCPFDQTGEYSVYHTFIIQAERRDQLQAYLESKGVGSKIHYPIPIHLQKAAEKLGYGKGSLPIAEAQAEKILSLPVYPELSQEQLEYVVANVLEFYK